MTKSKKIITKSALETQKSGEKLAKEIFKNKNLKSAVVIGLRGELGTGKTTFLQGFVKGLGIKEKILSPTFVIYKKFQIPPLTTEQANSRFQDFYHFDCYRIQNPKEILSLGFKEIISNPKNIIAIEWAEKIRKILSRDIIMLKFEFIGDKKRKITLIVYPLFKNKIRIF